MTNVTNAVALEKISPIRVLCLGPAGGSLGGAVALFQVFTKGLAEQNDLTVDIIDTAPPPENYQNREELINVETINRFRYVLQQYIRKLRYADVVLVFANKNFALTVVPILFFMARMMGKPLYVKTIAGNLDLGLQELPTPAQKYAVTVFNSVAGVFAETQLLQQKLEAQGCRRVYYVPNCRPQPKEIRSARIQVRKPGTLHLIYVSHIYELKGVSVLLQALRRLLNEDELSVTCHFFGPIFQDYEEQFFAELERTSNAIYHGMLNQSEVLPMLTQYDALVLPTYHVTEGHPGAIIEAMQAGIPIISTQLRAIPELVEHEVNGLLVPPKDMDALAAAIKRMAEDPEEATRMGQASWEHSRQFTTERAVAETLRHIRPCVQ